MTANKNRTPSKCRDWERQRRNRINDAFKRLANLLLEDSEKRLSLGSKDNGKAINLHKVEILEKAIKLINCMKEKIMTLNQSVKSVSLTKINKERSCLQDKTDSAKSKIKKKIQRVVTNNNSINQKKMLRKLLPNTTLMKKKGITNDKTMVILPNPQIFMPPRPFIVPAPTTFLLLPQMIPNTQNSGLNISKPLLNDITKTTMTYSCPLSASKQNGELNSLHPKGNVAPKVGSHSHRKLMRSLKQKNNLTKNNPVVRSNKENLQKGDEKETARNAVEHPKPNEVSSKVTLTNECTLHNNKNVSKNNDMNVDSSNVHVITNFVGKNNEEKSKISCSDLIVDSTRISSNTLLKEKPNEHKLIQCTPKTINDIDQTTYKTFEMTPTSKASGTNLKENHNVKIIDTESKQKIDIGNKTSTSILHQPVCEHTNREVSSSRLDLAEEFLAASPTAAFLLSFPVVAGTRPDSPDNNPQCVLPENNSLAIANVCDSKENKNSSLSTMSNIVTCIEEKVNVHVRHNKTNKISFDEVTSELNNKSKVLEAKQELNITMQEKQQNIPIFNSTDMFSHINSVSKASAISTVSTKSNIFTQPNISIAKTNYTQVDLFSNYNNTVKFDHQLKNNSTKLFPAVGLNNNAQNTLVSCSINKVQEKSQKIDFYTNEDNYKLTTSKYNFDFDINATQKALDFCNPTLSSNFLAKESVMPTISSCNNYNPVNSDYPVSYTSQNFNNNNTSKKTNKPMQNCYSDISNLCSQAPNVWSDELNYSSNVNNNSFYNKHLLPGKLNSVWPPIENANEVTKSSHTTKPPVDVKYSTQHKVVNQVNNSVYRPPFLDVTQLVSEKINKKSPTKSHVNWMTSEVKYLQSNYDLYSVDAKESKAQYTNNNQPNQFDHQNYKKQEVFETIFPVTNFTQQAIHDDYQPHNWHSRQPNASEMCIDPPPINLPTLVGDLALGPLEKRKGTEQSIRSNQSTDITNLGVNFFSVSQLMERSGENAASQRYTHRQSMNHQNPSNSINTQGSNESNKMKPTKMESIFQCNNTVPDIPDRPIITGNDIVSQPCYFNDMRPITSHLENPTNMQTKYKQKNKTNKGSYSAEALMRSVNTNAKEPAKTNGTQKNYQDSESQSISGTLHVPPILDFTDSTCVTQQLSSNGLYGTPSNTFYQNYIPTSNVMSTSYSSSYHSTDFMELANTDCSYMNNKLEPYKTNDYEKFGTGGHSKMTQIAKDSTLPRHKLETKKETTKRSQSRKSKTISDNDVWNFNSDPYWSPKIATKRNSSVLQDENFTNCFPTNHIPAYNMDIFNTHSMTHVLPISSSCVPGHNMARTNFNLSTLIPEIAKGLFESSVQENISVTVIKKYNES